MRILLVTSRFPLPPWRGNQARMIQWLGALAEHELGLVAPRAAGASGERLRAEHGVRLFPYASGGAAAGLGALRALASGRPVQEGIYDHGAARAACRRALDAGSWDVAVVQMVRCWWALEELQRRAPGLPVLFDAIDAMGLHFARAAHGRRGPLAALRRLEAARCRRLESRMAERAAHTVAVAPRDLEALGPPAGRGRVIPVAAAPRPATDVASAGTVLLSGNLGYRPTVEGALWFARRVWPRLAERYRNARWVLAGARPPASIRRLARFPGVEVHGDVPDLGPYLAAARVAIAPMASGSGVPMKVLEAWSCGVPVVAHPWTAAGLAETDGVVVAGEGSAWVEALDLLLADGGEAARLGQRGRKVWARRYRPEAVEAAIREVVRETVSGTSPSGGLPS